MTQLILVRHGESNVTVRRIIGGMRSCTGLSELGIQQTERLRDRLLRTGEVKIDSLVCSSMSRAQQTADILAPALGVGAPLAEADWAEQDPGECDGLGFDEYVAKYGRPVWDLDSEIFKGGETLRQFQKRVHAVLDRLLDEAPDQTVMVVCHGGVIDAALRHLLQLPPVGQVMLSTTNTSLTELRQVGEVWQLLRYNDAAHLEGLRPETPTGVTTA